MFHRIIIKYQRRKFTTIKQTLHFLLEEVLQPAFEENPNISVIGENEYINNIFENNQKKFLLVHFLR